MSDGMKLVAWYLAGFAVGAWAVLVARRVAHLGEYMVDDVLEWEGAPV